jgi:hypothetical protein
MRGLLIQVLLYFVLELRWLGHTARQEIARYGRVHYICTIFDIGYFRQGTISNIHNWSIMTENLKIISSYAVSDP